MHKLYPLAIIALLSLVSTASAQSTADVAAIRQTALDYIEGWYAKVMPSAWKGRFILN